MRRLNFYYYGMMLLAIVAGALSYALIMKEMVTPISPMSAWGRAIQSFIMMDALFTIPFGLWWHKRRCKKIALIEDETVRTKNYCKSAALRIVLVSNAMVPGIAAFYLMGAYQSMLWLAAIAAIGWYFTKPTERKMLLELQPPTQETY